MHHPELCKLMKTVEKFKIKIGTDMAFRRYTYSDIYRVSQKRWISVQTAVEGIRTDLWITVGGVLENSGYFLFN